VKILLSWLREFIDIQVPPEKIAESLLMAGIEVESIEQPQKHLKKVVVGKILSIASHPNSEKNSLCMVDVGQEAPLQIVCGAHNIKMGNKVPVALAGASLPKGFEIRNAVIKGVESFGMMCSKKELGISDDHSGVYILDDDAEVGEDIVKTLDLDDVILEISITPNRGDALSHLGIARELSALFNLPLHRDALDTATGDDHVEKLSSVEIHVPKLCPRYAARIVRNVKVRESPKWMRDRLEKVGIRAINNVVDVSNYVMMHIGHPMHAFDFDRLRERRIIVRNAMPGEIIRTLDDVERRLDPSMLVIADAQKPAAIAGVMGGLESMVTENTSNILLEAAYFDPTCVRKTSKTLGLPSESSYRFERGTNIDNLAIALNLAARLLSDTADGKPVSGIIDVYPESQPLRRIMLRTRRVSKVLGIDLNPRQIETLLLRLKLEVAREGETLWIGVPPFRHDLEQEADLIEEVARLYGYDNIPSTLPVITSPLKRPTAIQAIVKKLRGHLVTLGFNEILTYSFIPTDTPQALTNGCQLKIVNPLSDQQAEMRSSLLYGMLDALKRNILADEYELKFFEMGRIYLRTSTGFSDEHDNLCLGMTGTAYPQDWKQNNVKFDIHQMKGMVSALGKLIGHNFDFSVGNNKAYHPGIQLQVRLNDKIVGHMGQIHPQFLDNKKYPEGIFLAELDLSAMMEIPVKIPRMKAISEYPAIRRDFALVLPLTATYGQIEKIFIEEGGELLENFRLFDIYQGKGIDPDKRSMAFTLTFRSQNRTLKEEEVQPRIEAILKKVENRLQGKLREK